MPHAEFVDLPDTDIARAVCGHRDEYLRILQNELTVDVHVRGNRVQFVGDPVDVEVARRTLTQLYELAAAGFSVSATDVLRAAQILRDTPDTRLRDIFLDTVFQAAKNRVIAPKTLAQKRYVDLIRGNDVVFGVGPAGTGKTYLAMAVAVDALMRKRVKRIVLTRPAVEAGERLGFLPGDMQAKVSPYLRPLYDALNEMLDFERAAQLVERGVIEVAPLAFMRGRTLNESFIILDEAQNTTRQQMKMFLTRLGMNSNAVVTGDLTQIDLDTREESGLSHALGILANVEGIGVCRFSEADVVRNPLVRRIVSAYERAEALAGTDTRTRRSDSGYRGFRGPRTTPTVAAAPEPPRGEEAQS